MSEFFLRTEQIHNPPQVWRITDDEAELLGVTNARSGPGTYFRRGEHKTIWHAIEAGASGWLNAEDLSTSPFHRLDLAPKHYYPRMARPLLLGAPVSPSSRIEAEVVATNIGQSKTVDFHRELTR